MTQKLTPKQSRFIRYWFKKIDEHTIELKLKQRGKLSLVIFTLLAVFIYSDFIREETSQGFFRDIAFTFQPNTRFQNAWNTFRSRDNPELDILGNSKETFFKDMWETHKHRVWRGYFAIGRYIVLLGLFLLPNKKRIRFDRRRGIIYTYIDKKFYITEVKKLMRPLPEYFINSGRLIFWIHPYTETKPLLTGIFRGSQCTFFDYTMYFPVLLGGILFNQTIFEKSGSAQLKKFLVDFMNPDLEPEKLNNMMNALEGKKSINERLLSLAFGWIDGGLYTKKLPPQEKLEAMITKYFREEASKIRALPSFTLFDETDMKVWRKPTLVIVSVEANRKAGFKKVPCPNLYEYPETTMHRSENQPDVAWGNVKGREI